MNTANILCFLSGSLVATIAAAMYAIHAERLNWHNIAAARSAGYWEGFAIGKMQPLQPYAQATEEVKP